MREKKTKAKAVYTLSYKKDGNLMLIL